MDVITKRDLVAELEANSIKGFSPIDQSLREEAREVLKKMGFPVGKNEEYRFTPIVRTLEKEFETLAFSNAEGSSIESIDQFLIDHLDANVLVFINGIYVAKFSRIISNSSLLEVKPLSKALAENPGIVDLYFGKKSLSSKDAFAALNTSLWSEGLFINVPKNTSVDEPIFFLHINDASKSKVNSHSRLLCILGKDSEISIVEKFEGIGSNSSFSTFVEEIVVSENATLNYYKIQNDHGKAIQVCNTAIHQSDKSHVNTFTLTLDGQLIRNNLSIFIDGENCESHFHGLYLLTGNTLADNHTVVDHLKPNSFSNELYKGVMDENAKGVFNGKIYVRPYAQKTNAFQSNRNVLLTDSSTINSKPQLEIWADDVKCSHGCTTGQLDEEALFYLQSRGINKETARAMLLYAFASEVIETIKDERLKTYFDELIAERLHKNF